MFSTYFGLNIIVIKIQRFWLGGEKLHELTFYQPLLLLDQSVHLIFLTLQQCVLLIEISDHLQISYLAVCKNYNGLF